MFAAAAALHIAACRPSQQYALQLMQAYSHNELPADEMLSPGTLEGTHVQHERQRTAPWTQRRQEEESPWEERQLQDVPDHGIQSPFWQQQHLLPAQQAPHRWVLVRAVLKSAIAS